ncbi:CDP-alcohol phosphatidyltransferase family protein [Nonomuraea sp. NPDC049141]|uniref:CDP-alcohol phosphatidyltransferase family protein n=1 Tax=unclassified Nonomuraea TaxID=2593643 RepID=UPI0033DE59B1
MRTYSLDDVYSTRKRRDSWWTVYFVDPVACRAALLVANRTRLTPNQLTVLSLVLGMVSATFFAMDRLAAGAAMFYLSFMVDCLDGKIARLKGSGTPFGLWLDYLGDRIRVVFCAAGLAYGQYAITGDVGYVVMGAAVAVVDLFRYVNAPQMRRVRETVRAEAEAGADAETEAEADGADRAEDDEVEVRIPRQRPPLSRRRRLARRLNKAMARRRIRTHLISGIEFHAAVFVVAPLLGTVALIPISAVASVLLLANEVVLVRRMWLFTRKHRVPSKGSREHVLV